MKIHFSVAFAQPAEVIFPYISDPSTYADYVPAVVERTLLGDGPVGPGSVWRAVDRVGPIRFEFTEELVELEPGHRVLWRHGSPWNATTAVRIAPHDGGSILTLDFEGRLSGPLRWMELLPDALTTRVLRGDFERLGKLLDSGALPA